MGKKITPERREQRKQSLELLQGAGITDVAGVQEFVQGDLLWHFIPPRLRNAEKNYDPFRFL